MATSRTGTAKYKRNRGAVIREARRGGLTHCPGYANPDGTYHSCGVELDYETPKTPRSAETDHVLEWKDGGGDQKDNLRVLCRACNLSRNKTKSKTPMPAPIDTGHCVHAEPQTFATSQAW